MKAIRRFINTLREGIKGIWKHKHLGYVSVTSTFFTLFVIGIIIIVTLTINNIAYQIQGKVTDVEIFLKNDISEYHTEKMQKFIESTNFEKSIEYRSSEDALEVMKKSWGENANLLENIEAEGLLPASFVVKLSDISNVETFADQIKTNNEFNQYIDDIKYYKDLVNQVEKASNYVKIFGTILVLILMVVTFFIMSNTIKLTVISRTNEIAVMRYVGATNGYIRIPFIIEAIFFSVFAAILSYLAVYFLYDYIYYNFGAKISEGFALISLVSPEQIKFELLKIFAALGLGIGVLGSVFSIRKYLQKKEVTYDK